jgi:outer membrane immunogenic protein
MEFEMKKALMILAAGSAFVAVPALAQGADPTFTGPRVGVLLGYDISQAGSSVDDDSEIDNDQSMEGLLYGVEAGYDVSLGGLVVGAEASYTDSTAKTEFEDGDFEGFGLGSVKANRDIYVGARIGGKITPKTLLYAKGGYTNAKFDATSSDGTTEFSQDIDTDGYRIGAGVEQAINEKTYAKLEYNYSNYSNAEIDFNGALPDSDRFDVDLDRHQVVASVGMRF